MFVSKEKVPVTVDDKNIIFIKPKLGAKDYNSAMSALVEVKTQDAGNFNIGAFQYALLKLGVVGWEGPAFAGVPFTLDNLNLLDPDTALYEKVIEELTTRNRRKDDAQDPLSSNSDGSTSSKEGSKKKTSESTT